MAVSLNINNNLSPGVYLIEDAIGAIPAAIASFNRLYLLGIATSGAINTPTQVISSADFINQFTSSDALTLNNINLFFTNVGQNAAGALLFFTRVGIAPLSTVTVASLAAGAYTLTINGTAITFTAGTSPTNQEVIDGLRTAINNSTAINTAVKAEYITDSAGAPVYAAGNFIVRSIDPTLTPTILATTANLTRTAPATPATASAWDWIYATNNSFSEDMPQGFLAAPGAFYSLTSQPDRTAVQSAMETIASTAGYDWAAFVDSGNPSTINTPALAKVEGQLYTTPKGHTSYFFPWLKDLAAADVSPAMSAAIIALRRYAAEGFEQPPAGVLYPMRGISDVRYRVKKSQQSDVNPVGINCFVYAANVGVILFGSRTRSSNSYYRFINIRIIFNVLNRSIYDAVYYGGLNFQAIDGPGVLFQRIRESIAAICYRFWEGGALYGATPAEAFIVVCNDTNNPAIDIEQGVVRADVYAAPAGTSERIFVGTHRVPIGQVGIVSSANQ